MLTRLVLAIVRVLGSILIRTGFFLHTVATKNEKQSEEYRPGCDPTFKGTDLYWDGIFAATASRKDYTPFVWGIRTRWFTEVADALQADPECPRCAVAKATTKMERVLIVHSASYRMPGT